jgi:hypothetical protein
MLGWLLLIIAALFIVVPPIAHPELTQMQLLITHWPSYLLGLVLALIGALILKNES